VAGVLVVASVSGCSLFERTSTSTPTDLPTTAGTGQPSPTGGAPAAVGPAQGSTPVPVPSNAPVPPKVPGYALNPASPTVLRRFQAVTSKFNGVFSGLTVRTVTKGTDLTGTVVLLGLHPELVGNSRVEKGLLPGMIKGMTGQGAKTSTQKIGGVDVAVAVTKTTSIVAWYSKGTVVLVLGSGTNPAPALAFAKAYLAAR
jgi:hypothetical protein